MCATLSRFMSQQPPSALRVSVVICAYTEDRWSDIGAAIESVRRQSLPALETILVVDHNPTLLDRAREEFRDIRIVENVGIRGLSGARNSGTSVARGEIVAFLDDDAMAAPDWLERLTAAYSNSRVLGVGGHVEPLWLSRRPGWFPDEFGWVVGCAYVGLPKVAGKVRNFIGANMSFKRDVIEALGGFSTEMGRIGAQMLHCEDTEFCIRVRQRWPEAILLHEPLASVQHRVPAGRARWSYFRVRCYTEGEAKARVARLVGNRDGLSSERAYVLGTLPKSMVLYVGQSVFHRSPYGWLRACAVAAGLVLTVAGYSRELTQARFRQSSHQPTAG
jgi:glucosyl-dolichyl phosphate glucuronosyltransferase